MRAKFWSRFSVHCLLFAIAGGTAAAQYQPGDVVVAPGISSGGRYHLARVTPGGKVLTIMTPPLGTFYGMMRAPDNRSIWMSTSLAYTQSGIFDLAPDGTITTVVPRHMYMLGPDGEGALICFDTNRGAIVRLYRSGTTSTIFAGPSQFYGAGIDIASGDVIIDTTGSLERLTVSATPSYSTILTKPVRRKHLHGQCAYDPGSDWMIGGSGLTVNPFVNALQIRGGVIVTTIYAATVFAHVFHVEVNGNNRSLLLPVYGYGGTPHAVFDLDLTTSAIRVVVAGVPSLIARTAVRAGGRHLCGISAALPGNRYSLLVSFPMEAGFSYQVGFSFGMRPGIGLPDGRRVWLRPDALLTASVTGTGGIFKGCSGVLDARGEAVAQVAIPRTQGISGTRVFAAAVTILGGQIASISAPVGVTIR